MRLIAVFVGAIALPAIAAAAPAVSTYDQAAPRAFASEGLPGVFGAHPSEAPVILAQSGDPRVGQLEEQVRQLTGRLEELNFQILQMQEGLRKMQEDVDFRLQDLEQKRSDAGGRTAPSKQPGDTAAQATAETVPAPSAPRVGEVPAAGPGAPERPLGSVVFDQNGNTVGAVAIDPGAADDDAVHTDGETGAALPRSASDPQELYRNSYEAILSGDYGTAEAGFRQHIERFPDDSQTADARYWLGEALLGQQRYRDAVEVFVDANKTYPNARKSPDMLLKLGVSLSALNQRDVACATFAKINQRYPKASDSFKGRVKQERALAGC